MKPTTSNPPPANKPADPKAAPSDKKDSRSSSSSSSSSSKSNPDVVCVPSERFPGWHSFKIQNCDFLVDKRYTPIKLIGRGAYGVVISGWDSVTGKKIAIKKIPRAFDDLVDARRILREVKLLRHFKHDNIIGLRDLSGPPADGESFEDIYMILDFMETDLHKIIYSKNELTDEHIQYFIYQILRGLKFIHSSNVIHRDLKPSNLLLNSNCDLRICDFGLARGVREEEDYELTEYVVTRWYRAPEVMCSCQEYDHKIDVWSVGCIMAELHGRKPLFPGDDYIKQMNLIFGVLGTPSKPDMGFISNDKALEYIKGLEKKPKIPFSKLYPEANPLAIDLMDKMLAFDPRKRISVDEALKHPYLAGLHNPKKEYDCKTMFDFEFEKIEMTKQTLQDFMWEEIYNYRPEQRTPGQPPKTQKYFAAKELKDRKRRELQAQRAAAAKKPEGTKDGKVASPPPSGAPVQA